MEKLPEPVRDTYVLTKLVPDGVYDDMVKRDHRPYPAEGESLPFSLEELFGAKLREELIEFDNADSYESMVKEAADILLAWDGYRYHLAGAEPAAELDRYHELIMDRIKLLDISPGDVEQKQAEIRRTKGEYKGLHFVHSVSPPPGDPWIEYYEANPSRYPKLKPSLTA